MKRFIWKVFETVLYIIGFILIILFAVGIVNSYFDWSIECFIAMYSFFAENMSGVRVFLFILFFIGLIKAAIISDWEEKEREEQEEWREKKNLTAD